MDGEVDLGPVDVFDSRMKLGDALAVITNATMSSIGVLGVSDQADGEQRFLRVRSLGCEWMKGGSGGGSREEKVSASDHDGGQPDWMDRKQNG